jgi:hypothetical protein
LAARPIILGLDLQVLVFGRSRRIAEDIGDRQHRGTTDATGVQQRYEILCGDGLHTLSLRHDRAEEMLVVVSKGRSLTVQG